MKWCQLFFTFIVLNLSGFYAYTATLESNGTGGGNWGNASSWDGSNTPGDMADGDTVVIKSGDTITITGNVTFNGVLQIYGVLIFDGGRLRMDSDSSIQLATGSDIQSDGNGQSDHIRIGGSGITSDDINDLTSPNQLTEDSLEDLGCAVTGDCDDDPLPVKIICFRVLIQDRSVKLEWATSLEENFDFFTIERSSNGTSFYEYGKIFSNTKFASFVKKYEFTDEMPLSGLSYYRLKATDFDGSFEYHGVVAVTMDDIGPAILLYPNPVSENQITASYSGEIETSFKIVGITGGVLQSGLLSPGINKIQFNTSLKTGNYFILVEEPSRISEIFIVR